MSKITKKKTNTHNIEEWAHKAFLEGLKRGVVLGEEDISYDVQDEWGNSETKFLLNTRDEE